MIDHKANCVKALEALLDAQEAFELSMVDGSSQEERDALGRRYHNRKAVIDVELMRFGLYLDTENAENV